MKVALKDAYFTSSGELKIVGQEDGNFSLKDKDNSPITRIGAFAEVAIAKVRAGMIEAKQIVVDGVDVGKKLSELSDENKRLRNDLEDLRKTVDELKKDLNLLKK